MSGDDPQPGLRLRVGREARRISSQHRQLDTFYGMVLDSLSNGRAERARSEFLRFHDALEAHFTVEEQIHFPALHGLRPELDAELAALVEEHRTFRDALDQIAQTLEASNLPRAAEELDRLVLGLAAHEGREERMAEQVASRG